MPSAITDNVHPLTLYVAKFLDENCSDYPILHIEQCGRRLIASYSRVDIELKVRADCGQIVPNKGSKSRLFSPSLSAALAFVTDVEAIRQQRIEPFLQFHADSGPSSSGKS